MLFFMGLGMASLALPDWGITLLPTPLRVDLGSKSARLWLCKVSVENQHPSLKFSCGLNSGRIAY